jgi:hypothetical protein
MFILTGRGTSASIPAYCTFDDPHMKDYYTRKFGRRSNSSKKSRLRTDVLYRITIKTADVKDAGTDAKVFLSINGSRDKICRQLLTHEIMLRPRTRLSVSLNAINKVLDDDIYNIVYKQGAIDIVHIRCQDLGILQSIVLEVNVFC